MTALIDFASPNNQVRLLIADIDMAAPIFSDEAIAAFLEMSNSNVKRAAAQALEVMAVNYVEVRGQIRLLDVSTNGPADAAALREMAAQYRKQADQEASGSIGYREVPEGIRQFDRRTPGNWSALMGER